MIRASQGQGVAAERAKEALAERPDLTTYEMSFWNDFHQLTTCRSFGMSMGPIPLTSMFQYATYHGLTKQETDIMIRVISAMDAAFMTAHAKRREAAK